MTNARIRTLKLRKFKSFGEEQQSIELRSRVVVIGRNNSGKSECPMYLQLSGL